MAQTESDRFTRALARALDTLGPVRTLDLLADVFLNAQGPDEPAYTASVPHVAAAVKLFEDGRKARV